jgi:hypothetical protein
MATEKDYIQYVTKAVYDCQVPARLFGSSMKKVEDRWKNTIGRKMYPDFLMTLCSGSLLLVLFFFTSVHTWSFFDHFMKRE